jgi:NitT/TauT family transport system ATP-binding protein
MAACCESLSPGCPGTLACAQHLHRLRALSGPRRRKDPACLEVVDQVYATLAGQTQPEPVEVGTAPGETGRTRALSDLAINDLARFIAHVYKAPQHRADMYQLAADLKVRLDALLPLTEAAELLGFATVAQGNITLTPLGETFADAGILARKDIFASRIRRLPIFRRLLGLLTAADSHQLDTEVVTAALELDFPAEEAACQAELLSYGDNTRTLSLEGGVAPEPAPLT